MPTTTTTVTTTGTTTVTTADAPRGDVTTSTVTTTAPSASTAPAPRGGPPTPAAITDLTTICDEAVSAMLRKMPPKMLDIEDLAACRAGIHKLFGARPPPEMPDGVDISTVAVPGHLPGDPQLKVKVYRPRGLAPGAGCLYWIHGGGMIMFDVSKDDLKAATWAQTTGCVVVSVDYRLAPETPAPGPANDCYAGLVWLAANADQLGIDQARILIGGSSAGGGLAAGTALMARDLGGPALTAQLLIYPMLDHRNTTPSSHAIQDTRTWSRQTNVRAWAHYLGGNAPSIYASPAIATDLSGLPPAFISVGTYDLFLDENVAYATALHRAGVSCELRTYPGFIHMQGGLCKDHPTSKRVATDVDGFLVRALAGELF